MIAAQKLSEPSIRTSLDLNRSTVDVPLTNEGAVLPEGVVAWKELQKIAKTETTCFRIDPNSIVKIQVFSEEFQRFYSLFPTQSAPTMMVSGFPMHRIKDIDPHRDTLNKIAAIVPLHGDVLDTTMGLGYTAIEASKTASVTTIELDSSVLDICRNNPWSSPLFDERKIRIVSGDSFELIRSFPSGSFSAVIHDPPTIKLSGQLYSSEFYGELRRVLGRKGKAFHYLGDPNSAQGKKLTDGAIRRLRECGFRQVVRKPEAFGIVAFV